MVDTDSVMNRRRTGFQAVLLPVAVMGMAVAWPSGVEAGPLTADQWVQCTADRAELLAGQLATTARQWWRDSQPQPQAADIPALDGDPGPLAADPIARITIPAERPASLTAGPGLTHIDLPPPIL